MSDYAKTKYYNDDCHVKSVPVGTRLLWAKSSLRATRAARQAATRHRGSGTGAHESRRALRKACPGRSANCCGGGQKVSIARLELYLFCGHAIDHLRSSLARVDQAGMSGIPVQNLNRKANATPKYHGRNCGCICVPLERIYCPATHWSRCSKACKRSRRA